MTDKKLHKTSSSRYTIAKRIRLSRDVGESSHKGKESPSARQTKGYKFQLFAVQEKGKKRRAADN